MNIIDKGYYVMYCVVSGGTTNPVTMVGNRKVPIHSYAYQLLVGCLMFYCIDVTRGGSLLLQIGAPLTTTVYIFGMQIFIQKTSQKKQLKKLDELIADMQKIKDGIS